MPEPRYFRDGADGPVYRVRLVPRELAWGGVDPDTHTLVFEDVLRWEIRTVELDCRWRLDLLNDGDLEGFLGDARG